MKKRIYYLNLNNALTSWLCDKLKAAPAEITGVDELLDAITELTAGESQSLMLEMDEASPVLTTSEIVCDDLHIFPLSRRVVRDRQEIPLTPKEFDILLFLARNRGEVFTKEQIYKAVWDDQYLMDDSNIMAFIRKLRKKIEPHPDAPKYILTIWGIGYKFSDQT